MTTVLLVGLNEQTAQLGHDLALKIGAEPVNLLGYVNCPYDPGGQATEINGIPCYDTPGAWLSSVDLIVPLLPTDARDTWTGVMTMCVMLEQALSRLDEPEMSKPDGSFCWIRTISPQDAGPELLDLYSQLQGAHGKIHNLYQASSLQPAPLLPADAHYRAVLHDPELVSAPWFLELLASQAATLAGCDYALTNHGENFINLLGDRELGQQMLESIRIRDYGSLYDQKQTAILKFGEKLCLRPHAVARHDVDGLREAGATDVEILEAVQATACFAYWSRYINGLGISMGDESIGRLDLETA